MVAIITFVIAVLIVSIIGYFSSRSFDRARYFDRVSYCCAYPDLLSSNPNDNIFQMVIVFNRAIEEPNMLIEEWGPEFIDYYKKYRAWLLRKYMNPYFRFSSEFPNLLSWKNRKYCDRKAFEDVYGASAKEECFFAQSFYMFWNKDLESRYDISAVECQMILGSISMMKLLKPNNSKYDREIKMIKELYSNAKNNSDLLD